MPHLKVANLHILILSVLQSFILLRLHCKSKEKAENHNQPVVLDDELMNLQHSVTHQNETIYLMNSNERLKRRKVRAVLQYYVPNLNKNPERYAHHFVFSFYPFRDEGHLKHPPIFVNYLAKLQQPKVLNVVNQNKLVMEPFSDFVGTALANVSQCTRNRHGAFLEQEMVKQKSKLENLLIVWKMKTQQKRPCR